MLEPDTHLKGRYRILHKIGGGGFGYVYKAIDEAFGSSVAIKEIKGEHLSRHKLRKAFEREAKLLHALKHDALPRVTDYFLHDQKQFLVMDFIGGRDLAALLRERLQQVGAPFVWQDVAPWADRLLGALQYLHSGPEPIIHRDIKPANIKLAEDGQVYLLDFGLAKGATGQVSTVIDGESLPSVSGCTRAYAPLEQLQDSGTEPQSDLYSLAATFYHLLTGQIPIGPAQRDEAVQRGQRDPLIPAHEAHHEIPVAVSQVISQALNLRWWDRIGSAKEMHLALLAGSLQKGMPEPVPASLEVELNNQTRTPKQGDGRHISSEHIASVFTQKLNLRFVRSVSSRHLLGLVTLVSFILVLFAGGYVIKRWRFPSNVGKPPEANSSAPERTLGGTVAKRIDLRPAHVLEGHNGTVWSVAFSPDGTLAASASEDATIILWDTKNWNPKFPPFKLHRGPVYAVAFSVDGKLLASGSADKTIKLWDTETGQLLKTLKDVGVPVLRLAFSPDGDVLASCAGKDPQRGGDEIRLWYPRREWYTKILTHKVQRVWAIAFLSETLASVDFDGKMRLWRLSPIAKTQVIEDSQDSDLTPPSQELITERPLIALAVSRDRKYIACGTSDAKIQLFSCQGEIQKCEQVKTLVSDKTNHPSKNFIIALAFAPDNALVSSSADNKILVWDLTDGSSKSLSVSAVPIGVQRTIAFSPNGQTLITGGEDHLVRVWQ
ncbi:MAG TPA: serine/threonine-protein kinase [Pyrinomonadaceae bacterium]|nr:serine/threonine-protein kinase [Pyrinomonadaceae bacterium]